MYFLAGLVLTQEGGVQPPHPEAPSPVAEQHLNILASLAETFNNRDQREAIFRARDAQTLFALLT